jgi:AraC-like DNA-binding protein
MERICKLMDTQKPYLNHQLKLSDVAAAVSSNRTAVSNCINQQRGCTFSQFINDYRISHAKQLMSNQPNLKISEVWMASGFNTESSFFRAFKSVTGTTPAEWRQQP